MSVTPSGDTIDRYPTQTQMLALYCVSSSDMENKMKQHELLNSNVNSCDLVDQIVLVRELSPKTSKKRGENILENHDATTTSFVSADMPSLSHDEETQSNKPTNQWIPTNLNKIGAAPHLPLQTPLKRGNNKDIKGQNKQRLSPLASSRINSIDNEMLDISSSDKHIYNSTAYRDMLEKIKSEYEATFKDLRNRIVTVEKENHAYIKRNHLLTKQYDSVNQENQFLKNQVESLMAKANETKNLIVQQQNSFDKLSQRYMSVNEAMHKLVRAQMDVDSNINDKGMKGALRALSSENEEYHKRIKVLEEKQLESERVNQSNEKNIKHLKTELESVEYLKIMNDKSLSHSDDLRAITASEEQISFLEPRILRVFNITHPNFDINLALHLVTKFKMLIELYDTTCVSLDRQIVIDKLRERCGHLLDCQHVEIYSVDHNARKMFRCGRNDATNAYVAEFSFSKGITGRVAFSGKLINVPKAYDDTRFASSVDDVSSTKTTEILCVPIKNSTGVVIGVLQATNTNHKHPFSKVDEILSNIMATQVGIIMLQSKNVEQLNMYQSKLLSSLRLPNIITEDFCDGSINLLTVVRKIEKYCAQVMSPSRVKMFMISPPTKTYWYIGEELNKECEVIAKQLHAKLSSGICGFVANSRQPMVVKDPPSHPNYNGTIDLDCGPGGMYAIPLVSPWGKVFGVVQVSRRTLILEEQSKTGRSSKKSEVSDSINIEFLEIFAAQIAHTLQYFNSVAGIVPIVSDYDSTSTGESTSLLSNSPFVENNLPVISKTGARNNSLIQSGGQNNTILGENDYNAAAVKIQAVYKGGSTRKRISGKSVEKVNAPVPHGRQQAAIKLQSWTRGILVRQRLKVTPTTDNGIIDSRATNIRPFRSRDELTRNYIGSESHSSGEKRAGRGRGPSKSR